MFFIALGKCDDNPDAISVFVGRSPFGSGNVEMKTL